MQRRPDDLEDLARRAAQSQNQIDPFWSRRPPWFVGASPKLMAGVLSLVGILLVIRVISTVWLAQEAWTWWHQSQGAHATAGPSSAIRPDAGSARPPVPIVDRTLAGAKLRGNPGQWFGEDAYPADAIRAGEQGRTVAKLGIDASGTPISCAIMKSSGSRSLDAATCTIALRRVQFDPPRDANGRAIASDFVLPVRWVLPAN